MQAKPRMCNACASAQRPIGRGRGLRHRIALVHRMNNRWPQPVRCRLRRGHRPRRGRETRRRAVAAVAVVVAAVVVATGGGGIFGRGACRVGSAGLRGRRVAAFTACAQQCTGNQQGKNVRPDRRSRHDGLLEIFSGRRRAGESARAAPAGSPVPSRRAPDPTRCRAPSPRGRQSAIARCCPCRP